MNEVVLPDAERIALEKRFSAASRPTVIDNYMFSVEHIQEAWKDGTANDFLPYFLEASKKNWEEARVHPDKELLLDPEYLQRMNASNNMLFFGARLVVGTDAQGKYEVSGPVGHGVWALSESIFFPEECATLLSIYLTPMHRKGVLGWKFMQDQMTRLRLLGVRSFDATVPATATYTPLLQRCGFTVRGSYWMA